MKTIFVVGSDGYIGHALTLRLLEEGYRVIGMDNFSRHEAVEEMGSFSALPVNTMNFRKDGTFFFYESSIDKSYSFLCNLLARYKPTTIINLAQQPSAPYSHKSLSHARDTTTNNLIGTLNLLYAIYETVPNTHLIQIGSMGEYDPAVGTDIAEGIFQFDYKGKKSNASLFPRRPGSFYHCSKVASTYYIDAACRWWGLKATDIMQGIVYGAYTPEIEKTKLYTRLDSDSAFGTVVNRFVVQAIIGEPLTIYGRGLHKRGFIALSDCINALMLAVEHPSEDGYRTWNQLDTVFTIDDIANIVLKAYMTGKKKYIPSPRKEVLSDHSYEPEVNNLRKLGFKATRSIFDEVAYMIELLLPHKKRLMKLKDVVMPGIKWDAK